MKYLNRIVAIALAGASVMGMVSAQQTALLTEASKEGPKKISIVAVGDMPAVSYSLTVEDGVVLDKVPESEHPPEQLFVKVKNEYKIFYLQLNSPMQGLDYPKGGSLNLYQSKADADTAESKEPFVSVPLPNEKASLTVFLLRNPATKDWRKKPLAFPLKDDPVSFPRDTARVVNLSSMPVRVMLGTTVFDLASHANRVVPYPTQAANGILDYKIGAAIEGQNTVIANFSRSYYAGSRMNLVIYDADGKQRKRPLESVILMGRPEEAPAQSSDLPPAPPATP